MIRMLKDLCATALALQFCACAHPPSEPVSLPSKPISLPTKPVKRVTLDADLQKITTYKELTDNTALSTVSLRVNQSHGNVGERESLRRQFAAILASDATPDAKRFVCRQLALIGTSEDVPALAQAMQDPQLTEMARYALERIPGPGSDKALVRALENARGDARIGIVNSLGNRRTTMATRALIAELESGTTEGASAAATALGKIGTPEAIGEIAAARAQADPVLRPGLTAALLDGADGLAANGNHAEAAKIYQELFSPKESIFIRVAALRGMAVIQPEQALPLVAQAIEGDSPELCVCAMRFVRQIPGEQATRVFAGMLDGAPPSTRVLLIEALAERGDSTALPAIISQVEDENPEVRRAALATLGKLGDDAVAPLLVEKVASETGKIQEAARKSLTRLRGEDVDAKLIAALDEAPPNQRVELAAILGARGVKSALSTLVNLLKEPEGGVRRKAIRALSDWADTSPMEDLLRIAKTAEKPEHHVLALQGFTRMAALKPGLADAERVKLFAESLKLARRPDEKRLALTGLADIKDTTALVLAMQYIDEAEIKAEAQSAALKIAAAIRAAHPAAAKAAADNVLQAAANDDLRSQAQELHNLK
jgi:HEAT repeat protein